MAYNVPLLNTVVFHVFSSISLALSAITCYIYVARSRKEARLGPRLAFVLSPRRNGFFNHIVLLASCCIYHVVRMVSFNVLPHLQGQTFHTVYGFINVNLSIASMSIAGIIIPFTGIMAGLFANLRLPQSHRGKKLLDAAQVIFTSELFLVIVAHVVVIAVFHADFYRHAAWQDFIDCCVVVSCSLIAVPLLFFTLRQIAISPPQVRSSLAKLFVTASFGTGASAILLAKLVVDLSFGHEALFTHRNPNYPPYQAIVENVEPLLELTVITFMHSLVGIFCSVPFLFSASTAKWLEDNPPAFMGSVRSSIVRIINASNQKIIPAPQAASIVEASLEIFHEGAVPIK